MTTNPYDRGGAVAFAAGALELLLGEEQRLTWYVDLRRDLGEPDHEDGGIEGYADRRWVNTLARLKQALRNEHEGQPDAQTELLMIVVCKLHGDPVPVAIHLGLRQFVAVNRLAYYPPPVGRWMLFTADTADAICGGVSLPDSYFMDGFPF